MNLSRSLAQSITYWGPSSGSDGYGASTFGSPVAIKGRWEDKVEQIRSAQGDDIISKSRVFMEYDPSIGGYLFLGASAVADPRTVDGAHEIQNVSRIPDLHALKSLKVAFL